MSLVIAEALPTCALLISDTRGCRDGQPVTDELRKIFPLHGGFFNSGPSVAWQMALYDRLKESEGTLDAVVMATQEFAPAAMKQLEATDPDMATLIRERQSTVIVGSDGSGTFYAAEMDWTGAIRVYGEDQCIIGVPPRLDVLLPRLQDEYTETISQLFEANSDTSVLVEALLKHAAAFGHHCFQLSGPDGYIGPQIEAGVILRSAPGVIKSFFVERTNSAGYNNQSHSPQLVVYRAYVRAKSLRLGREQGLSDAALELRVAEDLRNAFDPNTGIATLPEALKYAEVPTMSAPLGDGTFGAGLQTFVSDHLGARFIAPFVKASVNIFRYVHKSIPILNLMNKEVRTALARGGEEAAVIHARSALASSIYGFALYQAMAGNLTGRGPGDPGLRALWLKNHQPYSIRFGDKWVTYGRLDPLATPLGLIADLNTTIHESDGNGSDATDLGFATLTALFYNLSSKSYLSGVTQFFDSWASNNPHAAARYLENLAGDAVPNLVTSTNPDPVFRDVQSLADAVIARIPGWSKTLDPRFDMFGEPILRVPGVANRNQIFTVKQEIGRASCRE